MLFFYLVPVVCALFLFFIRFTVDKHEKKIAVDANGGSSRLPFSMKLITNADNCFLSFLLSSSWLRFWNSAKHCQGLFFLAKYLSLFNYSRKYLCLFFWFYHNQKKFFFIAIQPLLSSLRSLRYLHSKSMTDHDWCLVWDYWRNCCCHRERARYKFFDPLAFSSHFHSSAARNVCNSDTAMVSRFSFRRALMCVSVGNYCRCTPSQWRSQKGPWTLLNTKLSLPYPFWALRRRRRRPSCQIISVQLTDLDPCCWLRYYRDWFLLNFLSDLKN